MADAPGQLGKALTMLIEHAIDMIVFERDPRGRLATLGQRLKLRRPDLVPTQLNQA